MTKKRMLAFIFRGDEIQYEKTTHWKIRNALRESNQKRIMNAKIVKSLKHRQEIRLEDGRKIWECPICETRAPRLTTAHVGTRAIDIIDQVLRDFPLYDFIQLDEEIRKRHDDVKLVICCDKCNKKFEAMEEDVETAATEPSSENSGETSGEMPTQLL